MENTPKPVEDTYFKLPDLPKNPKKFDVALVQVDEEAFEFRPLSHIGLTLNNEKFRRVRFFGHFSAAGWLGIDWYEPHRKNHDTTSNMIECLEDSPSSAAGQAEIFISKVLGPNLVGMRYLAKQREAQDKFESISVLNVHGGGEIWTAYVGDEGNQVRIGTMQDVVNGLIDNAAKKGTHYDRLILVGCNGSKKIIRHESVKINFTLDVAGGGYVAKPVEWNPKTEEYTYLHERYRKY